MMTTGTTRPRRTQAERRESTRRSLIDATYQSILEAGYRSTTTRRVAELSGVSLGALAHHFPTRTELVTATLDDAGLGALASIIERIKSTELIGSERALFALDLLWEYFGGDLFVVWIKVWFAAEEEPELRIALKPVERRVSDLIAILSEEITPGSMRHATSRTKVRLALATMRGLGLSRLLAPNHESAVVGWPAARTELVRLLEI